MSALKKNAGGSGIKQGVGTFEKWLAWQQDFEDYTEYLDKSEKSKSLPVTLVLSFSPFFLDLNSVRSPPVLSPAVLYIPIHCAHYAHP